MKTVFTPNKPSAQHLEAVKACMLENGPATVRAFWTGEAYIALEGSHRVAAAHALGLEINIIEVSEEDDFISHDFYDLPEKTTVSEVIEYIGLGSAAYSVEVA